MLPQLNTYIRIESGALGLGCAEAGRIAAAQSVNQRTTFEFIWLSISPAESPSHSWRTAAVAADGQAPGELVGSVHFPQPLGGKVCQFARPESE